MARIDPVRFGVIVAALFGTWQLASFPGTLPDGFRDALNLAAAAAVFIHAALLVGLLVLSIQDRASSMPYLLVLLVADLYLVVFGMADFEPSYLYLGLCGLAAAAFEFWKRPRNAPATERATPSSRYV